jgi:hypothetical protein
MPYKSIPDDDSAVTTFRKESPLCSVGYFSFS